MSDKTWLLNAAAIKSARLCIKAVEEELGVRLPLSHPNFFGLLSEYSELMDSEPLTIAFNELSAYANSDLSSIKMAKGGGAQKVVPISSRPSLEPKAIDDKARAQSAPTEKANQQRDELVTYGGKQYSRWNNGKEFKGLYRGRPHYI